MDLLPKPYATYKNNVYHVLREQFHFPAIHLRVQSLELRV